MTKVLTTFNRAAKLIWTVCINELVTLFLVLCMATVLGIISWIFSTILFTTITGAVLALLFYLEWKDLE